MQIEWIGKACFLSQATTLEFGTGWEPLIPILLSLAGAKRIYSCDSNHLCAPSTLRAALDSIRKRKRLIRTAWV